LLAHLERFPGPMPPSAFFRGLFSALGLLLLLKALAGFAAGWGLLQRESWARPLTLVLGFIGLINFPIATALGIYTISALLSCGEDEASSRLWRAVWSLPASFPSRGGFATRRPRWGCPARHSGLASAGGHSAASEFEALRTLCPNPFG